MANNGLLQAAKVAGIVSVAITIMAIVFYAGGQANTVKTNVKDIRLVEEANAATVLLVGANTGLIGDNTDKIAATHSELMLYIMEIKEEIAEIKAKQDERNK